MPAATMMVMSRLIYNKYKNKHDDEPYCVRCDKLLGIGAVVVGRKTGGRCNRRMVYYCFDCAVRLRII